MKVAHGLSMLLFVTVLGSGAFVHAQVSCSELAFTGEVASRLPNANDYCLEVAERNGKTYAHLTAEVQRVRGGAVHLRFKKPDGSYGPDVAFTPPSDFRVNIEGRNYTVRQLAPGQELDVWLPHDRWEVVAQDHDTAEEFVSAVEIVTYDIELVEEDEYVAAATLPSTASAKPMIGLLGAVLLTLGLAIGFSYRRLRRSKG